MSATREFNYDSIQPLVDTSDVVVAADSAATAITDTVASVAVPEAIETQSHQTPPDDSSNLLAWGGIALSVCVGVFAWKMIDGLKKEVKSLRQYCDVAGELQEKTLNKVDMLEETVKILNQKLSIPRQSVRQPGVANPGNGSAGRAYDRPQQPPVPRVTTVTRYCTMQAPDENGVLRISERSMSDQPSSQKFFVVEYDPATGKGIYRINRNAIPVIVDDLQMFRDFVKPFTFSGNPAKANIQDKKYGRIIKQGNYWVVVEPLEISIN